MSTTTGGQYSTRARGNADPAGPDHPAGSAPPAGTPIDGSPWEGRFIQQSEVGLAEYVDALIRSGLPGLREVSGRALRAELDGDLDRIVHRTFPELVSREVSDGDVKHLHWLREQLGAELMDAIVITAGPQAYRRADGVAVIPLALLGP